MRTKSPSSGLTCVRTAAGTTDGPGDFNFMQGTNSTSKNPWWNMLGQYLKEPPEEQKRCHYPKPIMVWCGGMRSGIPLSFVPTSHVWHSVPSPWVPDVLPIQILRLGHLFILGVPAEFTTMSGRRLRVQPYSLSSTSADLPLPLQNSVRQTLLDNGAPTSTVVVIAGLANDYSQYVATPEEYRTPPHHFLTADPS